MECSILGLIHFIDSHKSQVTFSGKPSSFLDNLDRAAQRHAPWRNWSAVNPVDCWTFGLWNYGLWMAFCSSDSLGSCLWCEETGSRWPWTVKNQEPMSHQQTTKTCRSERWSLQRTGQRRPTTDLCLFFDKAEESGSASTKSGTNRPKTVRVDTIIGMVVFF